MRIAQIATAVSVDAGQEVKRTVCVDDNGRAWELRGDKWSPLPALPACLSYEDDGCADLAKCPYHRAVAR